jgi:hypothetical protein
MNDWTAGYVADIGYTFGYYDEMNPLRALMAEHAEVIGSEGRGSADLQYVVSPLTGGGIPAGRFDLLFLDAMQAGKQGAEALASHAWEWLARNQQAIIKQGKTLTTAEENLAELKAIHKIFDSKRLPILRALGVI